MSRRGMATRSSSSPGLGNDIDFNAVKRNNINTVLVDDTLSESSSTETLINEINTVEDTMFIQDDTNADVIRSPQRATDLTRKDGRNNMGTVEVVSNNNTNNTIEDLKTLTGDSNTNYTAIKLNWATNKKDRYDSHRTFLENCLRDQMIPQNFKINAEPSIGNHDEKFLEEWNNIIKICQDNLMRHTIQYTTKVIAETQNNIKDLDTEMQKNLQQPIYTKARDIIDSTSNKTKKFLEIRKRKKMNIIKYGKPNKENKTNITATQQQKPSISIPSNIEQKRNAKQKQIKYNSRNLKQDVIDEKDILIGKLQKELASKRNTRAAEVINTDPLDRLIKEKDEIIETLKYDLEQESSNHYSTRRPTMNYSRAVKGRPARQTSNITNAEKNGETAPDQLESKQKLISIFTKEIRLLNEGMQNLENQFKIMLNTL